MAKVLCAMSGGVDSSVAAALLRDEGHDVTGVTLKLWGGPSDAGCCSVADVDDARRVAQQLGIRHVVFGFADEFLAGVVEPYVRAHAEGRTPNPCIECNRTIKFDRLLARADQLGFDALATGHHARIEDGRLVRGADRAKDQSYVLHMLDRARLARVRFPIGAMTKDEVRVHADRLGLRTATKPDSQEVCFLPGGGRDRAAVVAATPGVVVERGVEVGTVPALELLTVGQRRGLDLGGGHAPRYVVDIDVTARTVEVGPLDALRTHVVEIEAATWVDGEPSGRVLVQTSAHGEARPATYGDGAVRLDEPVRRVAPGQSVVLYDGDVVLGGGVATRMRRSPASASSAARRVGVNSSRCTS
ncbi:MAG: tRNA-uridine 2-sulfurtransferase [Actinomycetota bacterium]|jgi:tRNA-specific 2-thiouridylase|nr:tRNA-uridine 2-sulfurtransferase [Actinomycetota bacterium]